MMVKMHEHELLIDEGIVKRLIDTQCPQWKHLPILSMALIILPYYKNTNLVLADIARTMIGQILDGS